MKLGLFAFALAFGSASVANAGSQKQILCVSPTSSEVTISLNDRIYKGRALNCIAGGFVADVTPCAPKQAWSLSAPTGDARIVDVVDDWRAYEKHMGGVTHMLSTEDKIAFSSGFNSPFDGYKENWSFEANRLSGHGVLKQRGREPVAYVCKLRSARF